MHNTKKEELDNIIADLSSGSDLTEACLHAYWENIGSKDEVPDFDTVKDAQECLIGEFVSLTHLAEHLADETDLLNGMPENLQSYFDFEKYGRDLQLGGDVWENGGFYFWNR